MTRRTLLPMLGGCSLAIYILAPFCWLLLTSFMHEQDALSVPPQWIPKNPTLSNYMTFIDPAGTRAIVGSRAAEQTFPGMVNSLIAASGTAVLNLVLGTLAGYALARFRFPGTRQPARPLSRLAAAARDRADRAAVPDDQELRPARSPVGADRHVRVVHAAVHDLAAEELLPDHTALARRGGYHGWRELAADDVAGAAAGGISRADRGRNVRLHDGLERLSVRGDTHQHDGREDVAGRGCRLCHRCHDRAHTDGDERRARDHSTAGAGVHFSALDCPGSHERRGQGLDAMRRISLAHSQRKGGHHGKQRRFLPARRPAARS